MPTDGGPNLRLLSQGLSSWGEEHRDDQSLSLFSSFVTSQICIRAVA